MSKAYYDPPAGEWQRPVTRGYKLRCCDCALVHRLDFRVARGRAEFRVFRDGRCTAASRRQERTALVERAALTVTDRRLNALLRWVDNTKSNDSPPTVAELRMVIHEAVEARRRSR